MAQSATLWREVSWIRAAERVISGAIAGSPIPGGEGKVGWHLEDPDGETIDDTYADPRAKEAYTLLSNPQANTEGQRLSRRAMWSLTSRHMGICGPSFWYKDQVDAYGIPASYLYIRPDRLTPMTDDDGNLAYWLLDADKRGQKPQRLEIADLLQFNLEEPDEGFFGVGLVVSAINKIQFGQALDRHATSVVASGGRLSGIISPKQGVIDNDNIYQQLVRDWRNITEQPDAAKRAQVVRYPIEFTKTVADMQQLEVVKLLTNNRDELLELWGVPLSQIGGNSPAGLNSGDVRKYDRAALIQNAVEPRCDVMTEAIQTDLNCWTGYLGWAPKFVFDVPQFSDDSARHDLVDKDKIVPMKGWERRAQIGLDPLGPGVLDAQGRPIDDVVLIFGGASGMTEIGIGPSAASTGVIAGAQDTSAESPSPAEEAAAARAPKVTPPPIAKAKQLSQDAYVKLVTVDLAHQYPSKLLDWVKMCTWEFDPSVKLKRIDMTKTPTELAGNVVGAIDAALKVGADIDPLVLVSLPSKAKMPIANGNHRAAAAVAQGIKKVQAYIGSASVANEQDVLDAITEMQEPKYTEKGKADLGSAMRGFRTGLELEVKPKLLASAARVLAAQKQSVLGEVRLHYAHVLSHPKDSSVWWKPDWDAQMMAALSGSYEAIGSQVAAQVNAHKADLGVAFGPAVPVPPRVIASILTKAAARVKGINETTRDDLTALIAQGAKDGLSPAALGDAIGAYTGWDEYRSERIATTELARAYNDAALGSYREAGVEMVQADDACTCDECQAAFGDSPVMSMDDADGIEDHPNGTLEWIPIVSEEVDDSEVTDE